MNKAATRRRDGTTVKKRAVSETEALGQRGKDEALIPGSREYHRQVERLLAGKISYSEFMRSLERRPTDDPLARLRHLIRTLLEGIAGRSFPTKTTPR